MTRVEKESKQWIDVHGGDIKSYLAGFTRRGELVLEIVKDYFALGFKEFEESYGSPNLDDAIRNLDKE